MQTNWLVDLIKKESPFDRISELIEAETIVEAFGKAEQVFPQYYCRSARYHHNGQEHLV